MEDVADVIWEVSTFLIRLNIVLTRGVSRQGNFRCY